MGTTDPTSLASASCATPQLCRIAVYCSMNDGVKPVYREAARTVGELLARQGLSVVYGGARSGMMGALADAALESGGEVIGVLPHSLVEREIAHTGLTALRVVDSMHERKALMAELADAFIVLPGGIGTLEKFFEVWSWAQLGVHRKPIGILNVDGFWKPLLELIDRTEGEGFLQGTPRECLRIGDDPVALLDALAGFEPPAMRKWLRLGET